MNLRFSETHSSESAQKEEKQLEKNRQSVKSEKKIKKSLPKRRFFDKIAKSSNDRKQEKTTKSHRPM